MEEIEQKIEDLAKNLYEKHLAGSMAEARERARTILESSEGGMYPNLQDTVEE